MTSSAEPATIARGGAAWIPPGTPPVDVAGHSIAGGLFYVGSRLSAAYTSTREPALLDPTAPVRRLPPDRGAPTDGARPTYASFTPGARGGYLEWLAGGRIGPAPAAYLWLFLYGLERRVLVDLVGQADSLAEYAAIAAEVEALRTRYVAVAEFDRQAASFHELLAALGGLTDPQLRPPPAPAVRYALAADAAPPVSLRVGLGRFVGGGLPLPVDWAYAWLAHHDDGRRPEGFRQAFADRYAAAYPRGGLLVTGQSHELVLTYRPASPGFADRGVDVHTRLPDVASLTDAVAELALIATFAQADLDGAPAGPPTPPGSAGPTGRYGRAGYAGPAGPFGRADRSDPAEPSAALRPGLWAAASVTRLATIAGLPADELRATRDDAIEAFDLTPDEVRLLDAAWAEPAATDAPTVRLRYVRLDIADQRAVIDLLVATAGSRGVLEMAHVDRLEQVFHLLGVDSEELNQRIAELEVASVSFDGPPVIAVDTDLIARALDAVERTAPLVDGLVAGWAGGPPAWFAAGTQDMWTPAT